MTDYFDALSQFVVAVLIAVASASSSSYNREHDDVYHQHSEHKVDGYKTRPVITIVSSEDHRNPDGSSHFR